MKKQISNLQVAFMSANMVVALALVNIPQAFADLAMQNSWAVPVVLFVFAFIIIQLAFFGMNKLKDIQTIWDTNSWITKLIAMAFILLLAHLFIRDIRIISSFVMSTLLPLTPRFVISILIIAAVLYLAWSGLEVIARFTEVIFLVFIPVIVFIPISLINEFEFSNFEPALQLEAIPSLLQASFIGFAWVGEVVAILLIIHTVKPFKDAKRSVILGAGVGLFLLFVLILSSIAVIGAEVIRYNLYPTYRIVQHIRLTEFLDRLDLVLVALYFPTVFAKMALVLYGIKRAVALLTKKKSKFTLVPIVILLALCANLFFRNTGELFYFSTFTWATLGLLLEVIIVILFMLLVRKNRKQQGVSQQSK
ncbi:GerAB/ArcD/ProY family transporter [Desertibacillus haloalkaliphilus]|uniref:GerAB/ArcD/ProY family transporter n=1 Tax=Desertibacillus haloalkaliphilus TaxID=1328930 RepID=UPI001C258108|nr:endospore germination permease [Desertibacillus haloalkaliphilus]MBU8906602.1 endospore germination permease [Desertibacillus haloalkaliphilus]